MGEIFASMAGAGARVEDTPPPRSKKGQAGAGPRSTKAQAANIKASDGTALANELVGFADLIVQGNVGPEAAVTPIENMLIVSSLARLLHTSDVVAKAAQVTNPIALIVGVGMWGYRVGQVWQAKHPRKPKPPKVGPGGGRAARGTGWGRREDNVVPFGAPGVASGVTPDNPTPFSDNGAYEPTGVPLGPTEYADLIQGMALGEQGPPYQGDV
jgi:hypothetical protein